MPRKRIWIYAAVLFVLTGSILATQVLWIVQSAKIEESFLNQRVNMALCSAMDVLSKDRGICSSVESCSTNGQGKFQLTLNKNEMQKVDSVIEQHLLYYNIKVPFHTTLSQLKQNDATNLSSNQALLFPVSRAAVQNVVVEIEIPSKNQLILAQINGTFILSMILLTLLIGLFVNAIRSLARERRIRLETTDYINTMAHDLKTPISNISFALSLFNRENPDQNSSGKQYISIIDSEITKLKQRARQILGAAAVDAVLDEKSERSQIDAHALLQKVLESFALQLNEGRIEIKLHLQAKQVFVSGDAHQLSSAVINIIDNAIHYTSKPVVEIQTSNSIDSLIIEIKDNGPGIPKEEQQLIFKKGYRIQKNFSHEGFGLGLYLSKNVIEKHGGALKIQSDGVNGSTFMITLPLTDNKSK